MRRLDSLVYGVAVHDVASLAAVAALGTLGSLLTTYIQVGRAAKADPPVAPSVD